MKPAGPESAGAFEPGRSGAAAGLLGDLRFGWGLAALPLLGELFSGAGFRWLLFITLPWLAGTFVLGSKKRGGTAAAALAPLVATRAVRRALLVLASLGFLVALVFSPIAALILTIWAAATVLLLATVGKPVWLRALLINGAVAAVAAVIAVGGAEAASRTRWLGWKLGTRQEKADWQQRYDKLWEHNLFNFRSPYQTIARRPGVKRVYAAGDSYTWGDKIAKADSIWPARLERALRQAYPRSDFEVINTGHNGWTTANEAELLRRLGWQFNPDLVVVQYTLNDALPSGPDFEHSNEDLLYPRLRLLPDRFRTGAINSSALFSVLEDKLSVLMPSRQLADTYQDDWLGWKQMKSALKELGDSSRSRGTPVVFMLFPSLEPGEHTVESYPHRAIIDKVSATATAAGLHVLDLIPVLAAQGGDWRRWWATPYDGHPNSVAQALAARALSEYIVKNGWLAADSARP